jgi:hypothetical protein
MRRAASRKATLTVRELRLPAQARRTLCCTNVIEPAFSIVETVFCKVIGGRQIAFLLSAMASDADWKPVAKQVAVA